MSDSPGLFTPGQIAPDEPCPCGSGKSFGQCCALYLSGKAYPTRAETLMRSRFSAYVTGNLPYLRKSWHPDTCPDLDRDDTQLQWTRLEVVRSKQGLKKSIVEFRAYFLEGGEEREMHEISLFKQYKKRWVYQGPLEQWP